MKEGVFVSRNNLLFIVAMIVAGISSYFIIKRQAGSSETSWERTLINAGVPDQVDEYEMDQLENAKMVSEGSQFGVQYFNRTMDELNEELDERLRH